MNRTMRLCALALAGLLTITATVGCSEKQPTVVEPIQEEIEQESEATQQSVDDALNAAQATVNELVTAGDGIETRVDGLQIKSDLQELQRKLTSAIDEAADKKVAALDELTGAFADLIAKVDTAAAKLPVGGPVRTELEDFSRTLKETQSSLAAASAEASGTPSP